MVKDYDKLWEQLDEIPCYYKNSFLMFAATASSSPHDIKESMKLEPYRIARENTINAMKKRGRLLLSEIHKREILVTKSELCQYLWEYAKIMRDLDLKSVEDKTGLDKEVEEISAQEMQGLLERGFEGLLD